MFLTKCLRKIKNIKSQILIKLMIF